MIRLLLVFFISTFIATAYNLNKNCDRLPACYTFCRHSTIRINNSDDLPHVWSPNSRREIRKYLASAASNVTIIRALLDLGMDINVRDDYRRTLLMHACCISNNVDILKYLLHSGADPNIQDSSGITAANICIRHNDVKTVETLIDSGANLNLSTYKGNIILRNAARNPDVRMLKAIAKYFPSIDAKTDDGVTPLFVAVTIGQLESFHYLLENGADPRTRDVNNNTVLHIAAEKGFDVIVKELLVYEDLIDSANSYGMTPADLAAIWKRWSTLSLLIRSGAKITSRLTELSSLDNLFKNISSREFLLTPVKPQNSMKPSVYVEILSLAIQNGNYNLVKFLLGCGVDVNAITEEGFTLLWTAIVNKNFKIAELLVKNGANIDALDGHGMTALHSAAALNLAKAGLFLVKHKANVNARSVDGLTAMDYISHPLRNEHGDRLANILVRMDAKTAIEISNSTEFTFLFNSTLEHLIKFNH